MEWIICPAYPALIPRPAARDSGTDWANFCRAYRRCFLYEGSFFEATGCIFDMRRKAYWNNTEKRGLRDQTFYHFFNCRSALRLRSGLRQSGRDSFFAYPAFIPQCASAPRKHTGLLSIVPAGLERGRLRHHRGLMGILRFHLSPPFTKSRRMARRRYSERGCECNGDLSPVTSL